MATFNCACVPLFAKYEDNVEQILIFGETKDSISGLPPSTNADDFRAAVPTLPVDAAMAESLRPTVPRDQSVFGIPAPGGVDVRRTVSRTARRLGARLPSEKDAARFHELAVSPEGRALFLMAFWVMRAEQVGCSFML